MQILQTQLGAYTPFQNRFASTIDNYPPVEAPVTYELSKTENVQLHFLNGPFEAPAATGVSEQYGGPYYRFLDNDAAHNNQALRMAQSSSWQATPPEDWGRNMRKYGWNDIESSKSCAFLQQYIEQHDGGPFDGVLGFSEGASVAASLILRQFAEKRTSPFKFAIFICAVPPFRWDCKGIMSADQITERIDIPTAHIVGSKDLLHQGNRILYNLCHQPSASIFDHHGGHTIPWDLKSTQGITKEIRAVIQRSQWESPA